MLGFLPLACAGSRTATVATPAGPGAFAPPRLEFRGVEFVPQQFSGLSLNLKFELIGEDPRPAKLVACTWKVELSDREPLSGTLSPQGEVRQGTRQMVTAEVALPWPKTTPEIMALIQTGQWRYTFSETCNLEGPEGGLSVSAGDAGLIPLPKLPRLTVTGAYAQRFGKDETKFTFDLAVLNENAFAVKLDKVVYRISLEGKPWVEGELPVEDRIPGNHEASYDISTEVKSGTASKEILDLLKKQVIPYRLEGLMVMGDFEIPIAGDGTIHFSR
jgi:hypothetical protein